MKNLESKTLRSVIAAAAFAAQKHRDQRRKGAEASPYINHPIAVTNVLANEADVTDESVLVAALLHDTVEDTATTPGELRGQFGVEVTSIVLEVTDDKSLSKPERKRRQIVHAAGLSDRAKLVKLADKICNLREMNASPPHDWPLDRKHEYFEWARQVVDELRGASPRLEALFDAEYAQWPQPAQTAGTATLGSPPEWAQHVCDNLNRNVTAEGVIDEMGRRQGHQVGPELGWHDATPEFIERFNAAYTAKPTSQSFEDFVTEFVDAWPPGVGVMRMGAECKGVLGQPPYTKNGLWPALLPPRRLSRFCPFTGM